jgi:ATP-dependent 26S proteasome regulatory subunit
MTGILYITNTSGEYVKSIVPLDKTTSITDALSHTLMFIPFDVESVADFANNKLVKLINTTDTLNWIIEVWETDRSEQWGTLEMDNEGLKVFVNPKASEDTHRGLRRLAEEINDYVSSAVLTLITREASGTSLSEETANTDTAASATHGGSVSENIDNIIEDIRKHTKADIVKPKETLADYVCDSTLKDELEEIKNFFENESVYKSLGIKLPKGILFKGIPGTGKTYAARCIAGSVDCWFMSCTASALQGMYVGSGAENIRLVFKGAKTLKEVSKKGVIVFIDEIDSFGSRDSHNGNAGGEEDRTLNQLLAEMSGFEDEDGIMVLAATNYPERLDDALMRSGRFSRQITIERPDEAARRNLIEHYFSKIKLPLHDTDFDEICSLTTGFTPADIQEVSNESAILAVRKHESYINLDAVNEAVNKVITKNIRKPDKLNMPETVAVHEIGHVVAEAIYLNSVSLKVTNFSYGSAGGFTQPAKLMEGLITQSQLKGYVMTLLGGRVTEQMYGEASTGASDDLSRAKKQIRAYFERYHFEPYEVKELEQLVEDTMYTWLNELYVKFEEPDVKTVIHNLVHALKLKRVLYKSDIAAAVSTLITF